MKQRLVGYDLARAIAIFGMVIVNFKIVMHAAEDTQAGWIKLFNSIDGRASALFVILLYTYFIFGSFLGRVMCG